jgi:UDP-N-acetylglucosamine--N-acetylmuramyl-(pentapeptide) pyrophosphoryl-undecaprenol N-acetylglucosamine transferase
MPKRFVISGGGTGGHIFPAISIAQALRSELPDSDFYFVGALGRMEMEKVPAAGFPILGLPMRGFNRTHPLKNLGLPWALFRSVWKANRFLATYKPDAAIGVGGFASGALGLAAVQRRIPLFLQEQNAFAGKTNTWLGKFAAHIFVAHPNMERFFPADKIENAGNPVRAVFETEAPEMAGSKAFFGLSSDKPTLLVTGGSLGAGAINSAVAQALPNWLEKGCQVIWQTGERQYEAYRHLNSTGAVWVSAFIPDMQVAYAAADAVVSRAGAMAIAELLAMKKPAILVPLPSAAEDHQTHNAKSLSEKGAAVHLPEPQLNLLLPDAAWQLLNNEAERKGMQEKLSALHQAGSAKKIAQSILNRLNP